MANLFDEESIPLVGPDVFKGFSKEGVERLCYTSNCRSVLTCCVCGNIHQTFHRIRSVSRNIKEVSIFQILRNSLK
ncbi:hypothetical protein ASPWEDRAFT_577772 [Aspergillus wentii DTO 134E9]|uniref:Uncharacterized protein n=1 Tax=Aspergillus wentii DTO 134E9 TaxID=1073089 RepID=A0A1L9RHB2_ASPWE|nr:uncharacterized protein ASPWEDRAFT_577772 [Aspergillus wentii DTO 134E9]OJJ34326.1 hypothetical protein ASPWEDRAFT_577772 [Aspergillus wentii DTO 134E9]